MTAPPKAARVGRVVDEHAAHPVDHLLGDAADARGDDRAALPERLADPETEALVQALLDHHVGSALERVNDRAVLLQVVHRQRGDGHTAALGQRQRRPRPLELLEHEAALGIVRHRVGGRPREYEVRVEPCGHVADEALEHADRVLEPSQRPR